MKLHSPRFFPFALLVALAGVIVLSACDEAHSFKFVNRTSDTIRVTFAVALEGDQENLDENTYVLTPGQSVDTEEDRAESGDRGVSIFYKGRILRVHAVFPDGKVILDRDYSYNELKDSDFTVEIIEPNISE